MSARTASPAAHVRAHAELARYGYRRYATYAKASLLGLATTVLFGVLRSAIMRGIYADPREIGGYHVAQALTYVWLVQGLMTVVRIYGDAELATRVRSGQIVADLVRPVHLQSAYLAADLGRAWYHLLYRGVPPMLVGWVFYGLTGPPGVLGWLAFLASIWLAVVVSTLFRFLYSLSSFWLLDYRGVALIAVILVNLLSGFVLPTGFFPHWLQAVAAATPFPSIVQVPVDVFTGHMTGLQTVAALARQALWALLLLAAGRWLLAVARRHVVIQGG
ncbi:ABC transporter permease [Streptomyces sp. NPDC057743]|uniref:ABC transporter permease n=1 Tax=Streptomyces sp. NPDC057743 TaxID=3346236 RepID=UPI003683F4B0